MIHRLIAALAAACFAWLGYFAFPQAAPAAAPLPLADYTYDDHAYPGALPCVASERGPQSRTITPPAPPSTVGRTVLRRLEPAVSSATVTNDAASTLTQCAHAYGYDSGQGQGVEGALPSFVSSDVATKSSSSLIGKSYGLGTVVESPGLNQAAGNAARDALAAAHPGALIEQSFTTTAGVRRIDILTQSRLAIESKVGRTSFTAATRSQIAKDSLLLSNRQVTGVEWVFSRSGVTGQVGPTGPLADALSKAGISWSLAQ